LVIVQTYGYWYLRCLELLQGVDWEVYIVSGLVVLILPNKAIYILNPMMKNEWSICCLWCVEDVWLLHLSLSSNIHWRLWCPMCMIRSKHMFVIPMLTSKLAFISRIVLLSRGEGILPFHRRLIIWMRHWMK